MSIVEELGARVRAASDELPVGLVTEVLDRLRLASDRLRWVRQESASPMGVPELSAATEHAETAGHALRVAQDQLTTYLTTLGLTGDRPPATGGARAADDRPVRRGSDGPQPDVAAARSWWSARVTELTGHAGRPPAGQPSATNSEELLRRVTDRVRTRDRDRLHAELHGVDSDVGLGLTVVATPVLRTLCADLLGHPPQPQDLPRLRRDFSGALHDLLPGLPAGALDTLLSRLCRMPPPKIRPGHASPADPAVAAAVFTGLLMHRLSHETPAAAKAGRPRETHG